MAQFRKKPVVIEAARWEGQADHDLPSWLAVALLPNGSVKRSRGTLVIDTLEGQMTALPGDWVIKGVKGELYPCRNDIFEATYEAVV